MAATKKTSPLRTRHAQDLVEETLEDTPITVIQGARQVGKSTLVREVVADRNATVVSLDATTAYNAARADPDAFVRQADGLLVIDEVQRVPELVRAMKDAVEEDRRPGRFLVTGSADLLQVPGAEESLAGRAETVVLYGFSRGELEGHREDFIDRLLAGDEKALRTRTGTWTREQYLEAVCVGSYPEPLTRTPRRRGAWVDNYINRIMARDVQDLSRLAHLDRLPDLLRLLAANTSGELVKSRVAKDVGIPETSLTGYLDLLETLYLIHVLPAWGDNLTKRVAGRSKVALLDTGLAARLNHVTPAAMAPGAVSDAAGGLMESFVAGELRRQLVWADTPARLFHFRDRDGREVDIVVESDARRVAGVEMKAAGSVSKSDFKGLTFLRDKLQGRFALGVVLYTGTQPLPFGDRLWALPYSAMWT
ncbi:ATP-binding protein [Nocardioides lijunqiniae]|uniref:ATP-binding protein n=1 Tax=Nocardioides lijunqiniae TaxID=2760832 RepID=UPI001877923D|nr:ATP-binding protein [Nocardioides lijunqiniae]